MCKHGREVVRLIMDKLPENQGHLLENPMHAYRAMSDAAIIREVIAVGGTADTNGIMIPDGADVYLAGEVNRRLNRLKAYLSVKSRAV